MLVKNMIMFYSDYHRPDTHLGSIVKVSRCQSVRNLLRKMRQKLYLIYRVHLWSIFHKRQALYNMKEQRLGQGRSDKELERNAINGGMSCVSAFVLFIACLLCMIFSCSPKHYGYKGPKQYKRNYLMPQYLRETNYYK